MKIKTITIPRFLLITLIISLIAITFIFVYAMKDGNACISSPLVYGVDKAQNDDTGDVTCSCTFSNPEYSRLYFDVNGMSTDPPLYDSFYFPE